MVVDPGPPALFATADDDAGKQNHSRSCLRSLLPPPLKQCLSLGSVFYSYFVYKKDRALFVAACSSDTVYPGDSPADGAVRAARVAEATSNLAQFKSIAPGAAWPYFS